MARRRKGKLLRSLFVMLVGASLIAAAAALAAMPRDARSHEKRANVCLEQGDLEGALEHLDEAIAQIPPRDERLYGLLMRRGDCNLLTHRLVAAKEDFKLAMQLKPDSFPVWERLGRVLVDGHEYTEAALHFESASLAFPDRERYFRFAAGCAEYSLSQESLQKAQELLEPRLQPGKTEELEHALERYSSTAERPPTRQDIEEGLLVPPHGTAERDRAFELLLDARKHFKLADERLADYELSPDLDPFFGRVRLNMHLRAGRYYELRRTAEILLKVPSPPEQADEIQAIRTLLANGLHEVGQNGEAAQVFQAIQRRFHETAAAAQSRGESGRVKGDKDRERAAQLTAVEERLRAHQGKEALAILEAPGQIAANNMLVQFYSGYGRWLIGDRGECVGALERSAKVLIDQQGRSYQFRDAEHRTFVLSRLAESLAACNRPEVAARILQFALADAQDRAPLLLKRIELLRPLRDHLEEVVADEFELMKLRRDRGASLARWEQDWARLQGRATSLEKRIADQVDRVLRIYRTTIVPEKDAGKGAKRLGKMPLAAVESAGFALLRELESEPCLVLHVYRGLLASGNRDQAYLLLHALVQSQPDVIDFRLLLAAQDVADGRVEDAARELERLMAGHADDVDVARLAYDVARRRGDPAAVRSVLEQALGDDPTGPGRLLVAQAALDDGYPELAVAASEGADSKSADGRALLGLRSLAQLRLRKDADAEQLARSVLELEPAERSALTTLLQLLARRKDDQGVAQCDAWIDERASDLGSLDPELLALLARSVFDAGGFSGAEKLLALAGERGRTEPAVALLHADALFALGRYDEVEACLAPLLTSPAAFDPIRRMVLLNLARDGAEKAWVYLRDRLAAGMPERDVARWIALVAAAAGKLQTSIDLIGRRGLVLDENSERFIALASLVHNADLPEKTLPPTIAARMRLPGGRSPDRDRELERWVSLDLASPQHRFLESLLRLLLLEDLPTFAPLREIDRARLLERFPSLGFLTRERAAELDLAGQPAQAAATLVHEIDEDSGDVESLRLLALYAPELDTATLDRMVGFADAGRLDPAHKALLAARAAFNHSSVEQGMSLLRAAAEDPGARAAALLAIARTEQTRLAPDVDLGRAPWCEAVAAARMTDAERRAETTLLQAAQATGTDPIVLRSIARRLRDEGASMRPAARQLLVAALVAQPGPWFEAHAIAIDEAANAGADAAALEQLGKGLEAALQSSPEGAAPLEAIDALTKLAAAGRRAGANESARRWLDLAARRCPYHPDVLALLGHFALEQDDLGGALRAFQRAAAFGCQDPEVHLWLGEHALVARGAPAEAKARCEKTLALAKASTDSDLRARAEETLAKAGFLLGQGEVSRLAWNAAAKERGEDPKLSLPAALESFARIGPEAARNRMLPLTKADGPAQKLLERLCSICEEQIAAQKAAPAPVPVGAAGGAQDTPAK